MRQNLLVVLGLVLALGLVQALNQARTRARLGGPARDWLRSRMARRWASGKRPARVTRTYWSAGEYHADSSRLAPLGYREADHRDFEADRELMLRLQRNLPGSFKAGRALADPPVPYCVVVWEMAEE
ncbi:MAG TPA: hypothetical protein VNV65_04480 [Candidatus Solibacter sp.]|nr:hypothetical protein [Candidatus Solibacter sp.]